MRKIRLITNCERYPNYLMDLGVRNWLKTFKPEEMIFLVNNITNFDLVEALNVKYGITNVTRVHDIDEASSTSGCLVWDYCIIDNYDLYHSVDAGIVNELQYKLLKNGTDVVIFLDRDEVLYHKNLRNVLELFEAPLIRPHGIEIIQTEDEAPYDSSKPLYEQRHYIRHYPSKSKPCITRKPFEWAVGRHHTLCGTYPHGDTIKPNMEYPGLYLVHLDKIDKKLLYELRLESKTMFTNNRFHVGITDEVEYDKWFNEAKQNNQLFEASNFLKEVGI